MGDDGVKSTLFVGQAPGRSPGSVLGGRCGRRLASLLGVDDLVDVADVTNLLSVWPGGNDRGDRFPLREARAAAVELFAMDEHPQLVAVGLGVARVLGVSPEPLAVDHAIGRIMLTIPHPSGRCRWWNPPTNVTAASDALRSFVLG